MIKEAKMDYRLFNFPTVKDGIGAVEHKLVELMEIYRTDSRVLDPIELDYMDWANTVITEYTKV